MVKAKPDGDPGSSVFNLVINGIVYKDSASAFATYPLWIAAYSKAPVVPAGRQRWMFWQHTDKGQISGINVPVDLDKFIGTMNDLERFAQAQNGSPIR